MANPQTLLLEMVAHLLQLLRPFQSDDPGGAVMNRREFDRAARGPPPNPTENLQVLVEPSGWVLTETGSVLESVDVVEVVIEGHWTLRPWA